MSRSGKSGDAEDLGQGRFEEPAANPTDGPAGKRKKAPTPHNCRNFIRKETANAMPAIVNTFVAKAKGGSVSHFTSLAKVGGFDQRPAEAKVPKRRGKSFGRLLLDEVERYEARQAVEFAADSPRASQIDNPESDHYRPQERS